MSAIVKSLLRGYHAFNYEIVDPRTQSWFLVGSPWPVLGILLLYLYFVNKLGPALMENRKAFNLDRIIQVYNAVQVVVCSWITYKGVTMLYGPGGSYSIKCEPIDFTSNTFNMDIAGYFWVYYMIKLTDLLDTVFFILRKKNSQVTFLHVYHHTGMVILSWSGIKFMAGGHGAFVGCINCFVHAVMYSYYFLTNFKPEYKKNIWWKKHITQLQMFQFVCLITHFMQVLFQPHCSYPRWTVFIFVPQNFLMLALFWDFYKRAYLSPRPAAKTELPPGSPSNNNRAHIKSS